VQVAAQAERLAEENLQLKAEIAVLRSQLSYLHRMMLDNNNSVSAVSHTNGPADDDDDPPPPRVDGQPRTNAAALPRRRAPEDGDTTVV